MVRLPFFLGLCLLCFELRSEAPSSPPEPLVPLVEQVRLQSLAKLKEAVLEVGNRNLYPTYGTRDLKWQLKSSADWTSGFFPGSLWYAYELSGDPAFRTWALEWTAGLENQKLNAKTHDLGFRFNCSFGQGLRLAPLDPGTVRYREILQRAAATADSRFSPLLSQYPSDWDRKNAPASLPVVIDVMMNLELLLWAAENGGDPALRTRCRQHAEASFRDLIREDGSSYHVVRYDKVTGQVLEKGQLQGDVDSSTWSRGHAWMIYGLTVLYRYTKDPLYLDQARKVVDYFLRHLPPSRLANWDFQASLQLPDASASAIVCSALLELHTYFPDPALRQAYRLEAEALLQALCSPSVFSGSQPTTALLLHSTQYHRNTPNDDVPASFADYYFLESLVRFRRLNQVSPSE